MTLDDFDAFWAAYPRKVGKLDAKKAWKQVAKDRPPIEDVLTAIERGRNCPQWQKDGGSFIPYPARWLRRGGWDDEYEATAATSSRYKF